MDETKSYCKWLFSFEKKEDSMISGDDPACMGLYHGDPTPVDFLRTRLVDPLKNISIYDPRTFQLRNSLMLFGKRGAGKKTLVDAFVDNFKRTLGFALEEFNLQEFVDWVDTTVAHFEKIAPSKIKKGKFPTPTLVVVECIDIIHHCNSPVPENKLRKLMYHIRALGQRGYPIFIVTTCNESPGRLAREVSLMIDYECYVPPPSEEDRGKLFEFFIESWWRVIQKKPDLRQISVDLDPEDYELLVSVSGNCAPGDIWRFCQDMFHAVCRPKEVVSLDNNLLQTIIKKTDVGPCILHYDPKQDLEQFDTYIGKRNPNLEIKESASAQAALDEMVQRAEEDPSQQWPPPKANHEHVPWIQQAMSQKEEYDGKGKEEEEIELDEEDPPSPVHNKRKSPFRGEQDEHEDEEIVKRVRLE